MVTLIAGKGTSVRALVQASTRTAITGKRGDAANRGPLGDRDLNDRDGSTWTTAYGLNKTSPRTFYAHHSAAISAAAAAHESLILEPAATGLSSALLATP